jgi:hypothetical protein
MLQNAVGEVSELAHVKQIDDQDIAQGKQEGVNLQKVYGVFNYLEPYLFAQL